MKIVKFASIVLASALFVACNSKSDDDKSTDNEDNEIENKTDDDKSADNKAEIIELGDAENSEHLTFKGVPIDGTLKQFVEKMERVGFVQIPRGSYKNMDVILEQMEGKETEKQDELNGKAYLQGDFAGYKDCRVYVSTINGLDVVANITVQFPEQKTWEFLHGDYTNLKAMLIEKYGQPTSVKEEFQGYKSSNETDNDRMHKVKMDECRYETRFVTEKGEIVVWIEHGDMLSTFVCLQYKDKINGDTVKQHAINDL